MINKDVRLAALSERSI